MLQVRELYVYPIKSLGGIAVSSAIVTDRGLEYDRRWMLVDENHNFMTQRQTPQLALLQVSLEPNGLRITRKQTNVFVTIPFHPQTNERVSVTVWNDQCAALTVSAEADAWLSKQLGLSCRLVYMPDESHRPVDPDYARSNEITSFSDAYPFMMIGQSSLDDLNKRLQRPLPMNRFRPNIVFTGGEAYEEDRMEIFTIGDIEFFGVKPCARCVVTTINQEDATAGTEPLKTMATYRQKNNKVYFGQNLLHRGVGVINVGDILQLKKKSPVPFL